MADEVGFLLNPSVKKTWARRARTPVVTYRNKWRKKVSVLGAVALHPASGATGLLCDFYPDAYVRAEQAEHDLPAPSLVDSLVDALRPPVDGHDAEGA